MAVKGDILNSPENGFKRYHCSDSKFICNGTWVRKNSNEDSNSCYSTSSDCSIEFKFYGTKLILLSSMFPTACTDCKIIIDGEEDVFSPHSENYSGDINTVVYVSKTLNKALHIVKLLPGTDRDDKLVLNAIDIDEDGYLSASVGNQLLQPEAGWQRIDDNDTKIKYTGSWIPIYNNDLFHNSTVHYLSATLSSDEIKNCLINFRFFGSKIRIIAQQYDDYSNDIKIKIDGEEFKFGENGTSIYRVLVFEKLDLKEKVHEVEMYSSDGARWQLDAIDIDENSYMVANVGDQLLEPEPTWKRIDDSDPKIIYTGNWELSPSTLNYNSTGHYISISASGGIAKFKFYGTKLRLIGISNDKYTKNGKILIDNAEYSFSQYSDRPDGSEGGTNQTLRYVLSFEIKDLSPNCHTVAIIAEQSERIFVDAIDIDENGYMVASVGCRLTEPEPTWRRIDDTHPYIQYSSGTKWYFKDKDNTPDAGCHNSSVHYTMLSDNGANSYIEIHFYGTKFRLIDRIGLANYDPTDDKISIDNGPKELINSLNFVPAQSTGKVQTQVVKYEVTGLPLGKHVVKYYAGTNGQTPLFLDCFDIDEDGYIFPVIGQELLKPCEDGSNEWTRIDDTDQNIIYNGDWTHNSGSDGLYNNSISFSSNKTDSLDFYFYGTKLRIIDAITPSRSAITKIHIDGVEYQYTTRNENRIVKPVLVFEKDKLRNGAHKVTISNTEDLEGYNTIALDAIDIDGRILSLSEYDELVNKHLIKSNDKYYTIENDELVEITEPITHQLIKNIGVSAATLTEKQSLLPNKFKIISHRDNTFNVNSVISYKELIVSKNEFSITGQSNIDFFDITNEVNEGSSIKVVFSIDGGTTWKTYDSSFKDLSINIPLKSHSSLSEDELTQWNNARDIISEQGIDIANLPKIDFNTLEMSKIRFAYVLLISNKSNTCNMSQIKWQFDSKSSMQSVNSDELKLEILPDAVKVITNFETELLKINLTNGSNDGSGSSDINLTDEEIKTLVSEILK